MDKTRVKLFPNFTRHHLITHTNFIVNVNFIDFEKKTKKKKRVREEQSCNERIKDMNYTIKQKLYSKLTINELL